MDQLMKQHGQTQDGFWCWHRLVKFVVFLLPYTDSDLPGQLCEGSSLQSVINKIIISSVNIFYLYYLHLQICTSSEDAAFLSVRYVPSLEISTSVFKTLLATILISEKFIKPNNMLLYQFFKNSVLLKYSPKVSSLKCLLYSHFQCVNWSGMCSALSWTTIVVHSRDNKK